MSEGVLKKAAEILVECGYSAPYKNMSYTENDGTEHVDYQLYTPCKEYPDEIVMAKTCKPFSDTLEGRRQADAIEDWLYARRNKLWMIKSIAFIDGSRKSNHQWRLDRIKWCLEELNK